MKFNVFICLLCCTLHGHKNVLGQQEDSLFIQGAVVDTVTNAREFRLVVYNRSQNDYLTTTATGRYSGYVANNDTLVIEAVGYEPILFVVESKGKKRVEPVHYLALYFKTFEDVYVFKEKSVEVLQRQRETLAKKQLDNGGGGTLIGSIYTSVSKSERKKRKLATRIYEEEKSDIIRNYLYISLNSGWIDLPYNEIDAFLQQLTISDMQLKYFSNLDMFYYLQQQVKEWKKN